MLIFIAEESPRIVFTSEYQERLRYAALSHSWGFHKPIELTSENIGHLMKELSLNTLPKTFKDAIKITQKFGIDFLWIDSLCIIQNDEDDWQKESALMNSIYGGSAIIISTSSAGDSTEDCTLKPPNFSGGLRARITDGGRQRVQNSLVREEYDLSTLKTRLGTRAWALQENFLPSRTIHFDVVDANTTPYGHNPFGQVIDGFIRLACSTMAAGHIVYTEILDGARFPVRLDCLDDVDQDYARPIHLVPLIECKSTSGRFVSRNGFIEPLKIQGIVLQNTTSVTRTYMRIGFFNIFNAYPVPGWKQNNMDEFYEPFLQILEEQGLETAEAACSEILSDAEPPDQRYFITIT
ncbi:hypothetical protein BPAE_0150g00240 [Botrytis paeoniae]|uniref:Heterokaryon incompatibility domain-containing protein n=1 Tax=Botrytis paeoniae TaxID=278948 RepID=A0A4Z1FHD7_9HELO|nr:hypothetical protein BPAE_0150g00240 [Botrytis paeoniae]